MCVKGIHFPLSTIFLVDFGNIFVFNLIPISGHANEAIIA
jgi:hypothetical protein